MNERFGVWIAIASSAAGGAAAVATRYLIESADPFTLGAIRFGGGVMCLLPIALLLRVRWPQRGDWPAVAGLGFMFFAVFFVLYNVALGYTTVARGTLALSTLPLMTMVAGAVLGIEALTARKSLGVLIAMAGVAAALAVGARGRARGRVAGRSHHGGRDAVYGAVQRLDPAVHPALERAWLRDREHGRGRSGPRRDQRDPGRRRDACALRAGRMAGRRLSRGRRRRACVLSLGLCAAPRKPDTRRQHDDDQSHHRGRCSRREFSASRSRSISSSA